MGGCCCCLPRGNEVNNTTTYYYYPRAEEHVPLSHHRPSSVVSSELLEDTNHETSIPDPYRQAPGPIPSDTALVHPQTSHRSPGISTSKSVGAWGTTNSDSTQDTADSTAVRVSDLIEEKEPYCKTQTDVDLDSTKKQEMELSKTVDPLFPESEDEDVCPICLEEYDSENPKMVTKCDHHFHLACILEWMERSEACPVCDQELTLIE